MANEASLAMVLERYLRPSGYTPGRLAQLSGVPKATIVNWLEGRVRKPHTWKGLVRVAAALSLSASQTSELLRAGGQPAVHELLRHVGHERDRRLLSSWDDEASRQQGSGHAGSRPDPPGLCLPLTALPEPVALPPVSRMPLHRNPLFVSRVADLQAIARMLAGNSTVAISPVETAAATGLGGIGKTQLAAEFVHRYGQFFTGGVFWLSFGDVDAIASEVAACGGMGYLAIRPDFSVLPLRDQVELVLAVWREPVPRLLVFDNCEDEELLARWRPTSGGCVVLVTSRRSLWEPTLGVQPLPLDVLDRAASVVLLQRYLRRRAVPTSELDAIAEELGDLPLALHLAGSYLARFQDTVGPPAYLAQLRRSAVLDHPSLQSGAFSPTGHLQHVQRTFALSLERLAPSDPTDRLAHALLARAAYFAPGELIPRDLLLATLSQQEADAEHDRRAEDALRRLVTLGLVEVAEHGTLRLHRLVVQFVLQALSDRQAQADVEGVVLNAAEQLADAFDYTAMVRLQPQLRFMTGRALACDYESGAALATVLGHHLWLLSDLAVAQQFLERALSIREQASDADPLKIAATLNILGLVMGQQAELVAALAHAQRALAIWEAHLGPDHPSTDAEVNNVGHMHLLRGDYAQAEMSLRRSLTIRHRIYGLRNKETARVLHNLGFLEIKRGAYRAAHRYLRLALAIREQVLPPAHAATALTLNCLGEVHYWLGNDSRTLDYHRRALAMRQEVFGERHLAIAESLTNLGRILRFQRDVTQARAYQERAMAMHEALGTTRSYDAAFTLDEMGAVLCGAGEYKQAQAYLEQALAVWGRTSEGHPERVSPLNHLAQVLLAKGDLAGARACVDQALRICRETLGEMHPLTRRTRATLDALLDDQRD